MDGTHDKPTTPPRAERVKHATRALALGVLTISTAAWAEPLTVDGGVASRYRLSDVQVDPYANPLRMNANGVVVGYTNYPNWEPMRSTSSGRFEPLPYLTPEYNGGEARGVNAAGDAVGYQRSVRNGWDKKATAVRWPASGGVINLGTQLPADSYHVATDINTAGQVVGYFAYDRNGDGARESGSTVIWTADGTPEVLANPPGTKGLWGSSINDAGHVAGTVMHGRSSREELAAFFWSPATGVKMFGPATLVKDINDKDEVVGRGDPDGYGHAFYWHPSMGRWAQPLPIVKGYRYCTANAISPDSVIVGNCTGGHGKTGHTAAVAWERQPDGQWKAIELERLFRHDVYRLSSEIHDIDANGRMLYTAGTATPNVYVYRAGIATPVDAAAAGDGALSAR
jgi:uncharacterized membrane protein